MLLVPDHHRALRGEHAVGLRGRLPVTHHQALPAGTDRVQHAAHRQPVELTGQPEQTGALGDHRTPGTRQLGHRDAEPPVGRQRLGVRLGERATDDQRAGAGGQRLVPQRIDGDDLGTGGPQQLGGLRMAEAAARPTRQRHQRALGGQGELTERLLRRPGHGRQRRGRAGQAEQPFQIDRGGDRLAQPTDRASGIGGPVDHRRHAVPARRQHRRQVLSTQRAVDRHAHVVQRLAQHPLVPRGRHPVEDHPTQPELLVVRAETVHQGSHRLPHRGHVDHQHHRAAQRGGGRGRGLLLRTATDRVVQAHAALHDREPGTGGPVRDQRGEPVDADQPGIDHPAGSTGGQAEVGGVDVVRAELEPGDVDTSLGQCGEQPDRQRVLAVPGGRRAEHQARHDSHHRLLAGGGYAMADRWGPIRRRDDTRPA
ncbi:hypothetical protein GCM10027614_33220 [Micromonospora vulcania]